MTPTPSSSLRCGLLLLLAKELKAQNVTAPVLANFLIGPGPFVNTVAEEGRNWHTIGFTTTEKATGDDNALNVSVAKRFLDRADASLGKPANVANWTLSYDAVLLYVDIMRRNGIDGSTVPRKRVRSSRTNS